MSSDFHLAAAMPTLPVDRTNNHDLDVRTDLPDLKLNVSHPFDKIRAGQAWKRLRRERRSRQWKHGGNTVITLIAHLIR